MLNTDLAAPRGDSGGSRRGSRGGRGQWEAGKWDRQLAWYEMWLLPLEPPPEITSVMSTELTNAQSGYIYDKNGIRVFVLCPGQHNKGKLLKEARILGNSKAPCNTVFKNKQEPGEGLDTSTG